MAKPRSKQATAEQAPLRPAATSPLIFISHDTRDAELAELFSKLLSSVSAGVLKSFRSSDRKGSQGIEFGVEWFPELMSKLDSASDVVCLLAQNSLDRPWILYEAGVARGKLSTPVYGIALGIPLSRANSGPFAQFQNCDDNEESLTKLVMQLVQRIPGAEPDRDAIKMQVQNFSTRAKALLEKKIEVKEHKERKPAMDDTSVAKLFEEVKIMFQDLPSRIEGRLAESGDGSRRRRFRRFHPMMIEEMSHMIADSPNDPAGLLVMSSLLRDDAPWLYELGIDAYRATKRGSGQSRQDAILKFMRAFEMTVRGPFVEEIAGGSKESYMMLRELHRFAERMVHRYIEEPEAPPSKSKK